LALKRDCKSTATQNPTRLLASDWFLKRGQYSSHGASNQSPFRQVMPLSRHLGNASGQLFQN